VALIGGLPVAAGAAPRTYLASIQGIALSPNEYVTSFYIESWGVKYRAVCHIPPGWTMKAGGTASFDGGFAGEGAHSISYLDRAHLHELANLVLITLDDPVQRKGIRTTKTDTAVTFTGFARVGSYGKSDRTHRARLTYENIQLIAVDRCPKH